MLLPLKTISFNETQIEAPHPKSSMSLVLMNIIKISLTNIDGISVATYTLEYFPNVRAIKLIRKRVMIE